MTLVNDIFVSTYLLLLMPLTDYMETSGAVRGFIGWSLIGLVGLNFGINLVKTGAMIAGAYIRWRRRRQLLYQVQEEAEKGARMLEASRTDLIMGIEEIEVNHQVNHKLDHITNIVNKEPLTRIINK
jgi:hypothetical protein